MFNPVVGTPAFAQFHAAYDFPQNATLGLPGGTASATNGTKSFQTFQSKRPRATKKNGGFYGGIERKFGNKSRTFINMSTNWFNFIPNNPVGVDSLTALVQGTGQSQRLGRTYFINSIFVKGLVRREALEHQGAPLDDLQYRFLLVWNMQTNGTALDPDDVMQDNNALSFRNLKHSSRFIVLADTGLINFPVFNMFDPNVPSEFSTPESVQRWEFGKTFKTPIKVRMSSALGRIDDVTDNSFAIIGITSDAICEMQYDSRMRFSEQST